ncbi:MAG: response regulator [Actinomycetota bacterium]|nr:response regulator [Actinomycetota bacterium]
MTGERVLLIDDEPAMHKLIKVILENEGFQLVGPEEHGKAKKEIKGRRPDLIILDIMMPEVDGFEILERLKEDQETSRIPVIVLTVRNLKEDMQRAKSLGADLYMTKPFEPTDLLDAVRMVLDSVQSA